MKKVSKKVKFLAVVLGSLLISTSAFAQSVAENTLRNSAVKRATAGQFSTDSDKVNAKDIFDLKRSFFSAGYLGNLNNTAQGGIAPDSTTGKINNGVQGSFGIALPADMYLGIAAAYKFNDSASYTTDKDGNISFPNNKWTIGSTANVTAAFRINNMAAIHYNFYLIGSTPYSVNQTKDAAGNNYHTYKHSGDWKHEIAAAIKFGEHKLTIPVSVTFESYNTKEKGVKLSTEANAAKVNVDNVDYGLVGNRDGIWLGFHPEFFLSLPAGPMTGINIGIDLKARLNNNVGKNGTFNINGVETKYKTTQKAVAVDVGVWASFPMEWSLANDQVSLSMEPEIDLKFYISNLDKMEQSINGGAATIVNDIAGNPIYGTDNLAIAPRVKLPIGTLWRPVEWYELRFGTALLLGADIILDQSKDANGKTDKLIIYETISGIAGFFGMGFIITDDFNIDLYAEAQQLNFFTMGFGGQLTYRFN